MADRIRELADSINLLPDDPLLLEIANPWSTQIDMMKKLYVQSMSTPLKEFQWVGWIAKEGDKRVLRLYEPSLNSVLPVAQGSGNPSTSWMSFSLRSQKGLNKCLTLFVAKAELSALSKWTVFKILL